jgi:short-subunit dehydrogenase
MSGHVVLITGASSGIGEALAREYGRRGANLVLTARRQDRLQSLAKEIEALGGQALPVVCDVCRDGDLEQAVDQAIESYGGIDVVIANAGFGVGGRLAKLTLDDYRRQLETNLFGVLRTVMATRQALISSHGCLSIIGSVNGYVALPGVSAYAMSKAAVHSLATSLWYELQPDGIAVCLIAPGFIESEIRKVDNRGRYRPEYRDNVPSWLVMPADRAARKIIKAIRKRRRVAVITAHGKLAVLLQRFVPSLLAVLVRRFARVRKVEFAERAKPRDGRSGASRLPGDEESLEQ